MNYQIAIQISVADRIPGNRRCRRKWNRKAMIVNILFTFDMDLGKLGYLRYVSYSFPSPHEYCDADGSLSIHTDKIYIGPKMALPKQSRFRNFVASQTGLAGSEEIFEAGVAFFIDQIIQHPCHLLIKAISRQAPFALIPNF